VVMLEQMVDVTNAAPKEGLSAVLSAAARKMIRAIVAAVSDPHRFQETRSLRNLMKRRLQTKPTQRLGKPVLKLCQPDLGYRPTSSQSAKWLHCLNQANKLFTASSPLTRQVDG
jgi:hypothetical protein